MNTIIAYINSKDIGGNPIRYELQQKTNWQGKHYYYLVDAYYRNGKRLCENLRGFSSYEDVSDGLDALEKVSGKKFTQEYRSLIYQKTQLYQNILS